MANGSSSFWTQANALFRKNLTYQRRNNRSNIRLISFPIVLCLLLVLLQAVINNELDKPSNKCGCTCIDQDGDGQCERVCGIQYSDLDQVATCSIPSPPEWPPLLQLPDPQFRAVRTDFVSFGDLPSESCRATNSCPATVLITGRNHSLGESLARNMFPSSSSFNRSNGLDGVVLGSASMTEITNFLDSAFFSSRPIYYVQSQCGANSTFPISVPIASLELDKEVICVQGQHLWRNSSADINNELFAGYRRETLRRKLMRY